MKKFLIAVIGGVIVSSISVLGIPFIITALLIFGIAALPSTGVVLMLIAGACILVPGIALNIYLTRDIPVGYRISAVIVYLFLMGLEYYLLTGGGSLNHPVTFSFGTNGW